MGVFVNCGRVLQGCAACLKDLSGDEAYRARADIGAGRRVMRAHHSARAHKAAEEKNATSHDPNSSLLRTLAYLSRDQCSTFEGYYENPSRPNLLFLERAYRTFNLFWNCWGEMRGRQVACFVQS